MLEQGFLVSAGTFFPYKNEFTNVIVCLYPLSVLRATLLCVILGGA